MISAILLLLFISFYIFYATTERIQVPNGLRIENTIQKHKSTSKILGILLLTFCFVLSIKQLGLCVGILFNLVSIRTLGGLIILLAPLQIINYKNISIFFVFIFLIELYQQISSI